jgi:hypothetical protein
VLALLPGHMAVSAPVSDEDGALFGLPELVVDERKAGRCEVALHLALTAGARDGTVVEVDAGLAAAALVAARALDRAERMDKPAYAVAALLTPYREALHALRLPAAIGPAPAALPAAEGPTGTPDWLRDAFGNAE